MTSLVFMPKKKEGRKRLEKKKEKRLGQLDVVSNLRMSWFASRGGERKPGGGEKREKRGENMTKRGTFHPVELFRREKKKKRGKGGGKKGNPKKKKRARF